MFFIKNNIVYFIVLISLVQVQSLVELPAVEDNEIVRTELAVRNTVNTLFSILKLKRVNQKARFREFAAIHHFFADITLKDHDNLKDIARLARVQYIDNVTQHFITQLNEVLNEDNKSYGTTDDVYVTTHIEKFIRKLEYFKYRYGFADNAAGFDINKEVIKHFNLEKSRINTTKVAQPKNDSDLLNDEFWQPSNESSGETGSRRIYNGIKAKIKRFPFMASVQFFKKFQCGGSIIKSDLVITAASCLQLAWNNRFFRENPSFLSVQVGSDLYEGGDENIAVLDVYFHPDYNPRNLRHNLAIMRMVRHLFFSKKHTKVKKIDIDRQASPLPATTAHITIVGWGAKTSTNIIRNIWANRLSYAELDFYPLKECQEVYSKEFVTTTNFCAGFFSKGGGACNRDVGGPGLSHGRLVGVVSFGSPVCGTADAPTVFTKVGYYADWIESILEMRGVTERFKTTRRPTRVTYNIWDYITRNNRIRVTPILHATTTPARQEIQTIDALRKLDENNLFKDFITTMFGSEEVKDYLDQNENEVQAKTTTTTTSTTTTATTKNNIRSKIKHTTKTNPIFDSEEGSTSDDNSLEVRMVTSIDNFDAEKPTTSAGYSSSNSLESSDVNSGKDEDSLVEDHIAKLINDIDIKELFASDSSHSSDNDITNKKKRTSFKLHSERKENKELIKPIEDTESSSNNEDDEEDLKDLLNSLEASKKNIDDGLSIPAESPKDLTYRHNNSGILDIFSENDLMRLLSEAVAEAAKKRKLENLTS